jgi:hypothetical protein
MRWHLGGGVQEIDNSGSSSNVYITCEWDVTSCYLSANYINYVNYPDFIVGAEELSEYKANTWSLEPFSVNEKVYYFVRNEHQDYNGYLTLLEGGNGFVLRQQGQPGLCSQIFDFQATNSVLFL